MRGFEFAVGVNHFGAALTLGFRLACDGALHLLGYVHLFDFHFADLDAPGLGVLIENDLQLGVYAVALRENFVQFKLTDDAADGGLRQLGNRVLIILHLRQRHVGIDDAEITYGVYFNGDVVAGDDVLWRDVERFDAERDAIESFYGPED